MIFKWCLWGAIIGGIFGLLNGELLIGAIVGGAAGIGIRKWIFRTFWE